MLVENVRIKIISELYEVEESLFSEFDEDADEEFISETLNASVSEEEASLLEINTLGEHSIDGERITFSYDESEETGMEGSVTAITYLESSRGVVSMIRRGSVSATLVFEEGKRHHCIYNTPIMPFEVCVKTNSVVNRLDIDGSLKLDYIVEIRGAKAERTKFYMQVLK